LEKESAMTITISVSDRVETKLKEGAAAKGTDVNQYVTDLLEDAVTANSSGSSSNALPANDQLAAWNNFVSEMTRAGSNLPAGSSIDDSRESIYAGRGE
jgi:hypothetical protein